METRRIRKICRFRPMRLRKRVPGLTLDLCGIAKGYALDRIIEALPAVGVDSVMFELGGEIRTLGRHPDGRAWQIGIERPDVEAGVMEQLLPPDHWQWRHREPEGNTSAWARAGSAT
jgi:thiamine biosynthesis lipoprotein ApbE